MRRLALMVALAGLSLAAGAQVAEKPASSPAQPASAGSTPAEAASAASTGVPQANAPTTPAEQARIGALVQYQKDLVSVLALRGDAEHLLGAALLARPLPDQPQGLSYHDLITRAARAPDAGPGVTWAQLADCDAQANECPNAAALARLQKQAGDNAAVWMLVMDEAAFRSDAKAARDDLARAAAAKSYDDYFGIALQGVAMSVGTLPPLPDTMAGAKPGDPVTAAGVELLIAFGVANQQPRPSLQPLLQLCTVQHASSDPALKRDCLKVAHNLEWGSSPMGRAVGLHIRGELDPSAKADTSKQALDLAWQMQHYDALGIKALTDDQLAQQLLETARNGGTELSLVLSTLRVNNIPTEAPAGWQPPRPEAQPVAGSSTSLPTPGSSTSLPTPGSSTSLPASASSTSLPVPGSSTEQPVPGSSAAQPIPDSSVAQPPSGSSASPPAPGSSTGSSP
jgi:hypothetical protein